MKPKGAKIDRDKFFSILEKKGISINDFLEMYSSYKKITTRQSTDALYKKILHEKNMNYKTINDIADFLDVRPYDIMKEI